MCILCNCQTASILAVFFNLVYKRLYNVRLSFSVLLKRSLCTGSSNRAITSAHHLYCILDQASCSLYLTFGLLTNLSNDFTCRLYFVNKPNTSSAIHVSRCIYRRQRLYSRPSIDDIASLVLVIVFLKTSLTFFQARSCNKLLVNRTDDGSSVIKRPPERTIGYPVVKGRSVSCKY